MLTILPMYPLLPAFFTDGLPLTPFLPYCPSAYISAILPINLPSCLTTHLPTYVSTCLSSLSVFYLPACLL
jgi:hypothetical protein